MSTRSDGVTSTTRGPLVASSSTLCVTTSALSRTSARTCPVITTSVGVPRRSRRSRRARTMSGLVLGQIVTSPDRRGRTQDRWRDRLHSSGGCEPPSGHTNRGTRDDSPPGAVPRVRSIPDRARPGRRARGAGGRSSAPAECGAVLPPTRREPRCDLHRLDCSPVGVQAQCPPPGPSEDPGPRRHVVDQRERLKAAVHGRHEKLLQRSPAQDQRHRIRGRPTAVFHRERERVAAAVLPWRPHSPPPGDGRRTRRRPSPASPDAPPPRGATLCHACDSPGSHPPQAAEPAYCASAAGLGRSHAATSSTMCRAAAQTGRRPARTSCQLVGNCSAGATHAAAAVPLIVSAPSSSCAAVSCAVNCASSCCSRRPERAAHGTRRAHRPRHHELTAVAGIRPPRQHAVGDLALKEHRAALVGRVHPLRLRHQQLPGLRLRRQARRAEHGDTERDGHCPTALIRRDGMRAPVVARRAVNPPSP